MTFSKRMILCRSLDIISKILQGNSSGVLPVSLPFDGVWLTETYVSPIAVLHELRLVHTDLKPENILLVCNDYSTVQVSGKVRTPATFFLRPLTLSTAQLPSKTETDFEIDGHSID